MIIREGAIKSTVAIKLDSLGSIGGSWTVEENAPVAVKTWYDRSRRNYEIWLVDVDGNQVGETKYGFSKEEKNLIVKELESELEG